MLFASDVLKNDSRMLISIDEADKTSSENMVTALEESQQGITSCFIDASTFLLLLQCQLKEYSIAYKVHFESINSKVFYKFSLSLFSSSLAAFW